MRAVAAGAVLLAAGCAPVFDVEPTCPVPAPAIPADPDGPQIVPTAFDISVQHTEWWARLIRHGSDAQLAHVVNEAQGLAGLPRGAIAQTHAALEWRRANGCAPSPTTR